MTTTGLGVNFKVGLVVRPHQAIRLGAAVHSPTAFKLEDSYNSAFTYNYTDGGVSTTDDTQLSPDGLFAYKLRTPWHYIGSAGVVVGKWGFLSGEVEYADYAKGIIIIVIAVIIGTFIIVGIVVFFGTSGVGFFGFIVVFG